MNNRALVVVMALSLIAGAGISPSVRAEEAAEGKAYEVKVPAELAKTVEPSEKLAKAGKIVLCTELGNPPGAFLAEDGATPKGFNVDVMSAIGPVMGIRSEVVNYPFASIFAALETGKCDAVMANSAKTPARIEKYNFVEYMTMRLGLMVPKGNPLALKTFADLSGRRAAVLVSSTTERLLKAASEKAVSEGKKPIEIQSYPQYTTGARQLELGRVDAFIGDAMSIGYFVNIAGDKFEVGGMPIDPLTIGIVMRKDDSHMRDAVQKAYATLYKNGFIEKSAEAWGMKGLVEFCGAEVPCP
ncbi:MAG: ABC transporter substrate-binding protein [Pseudochelatococcus sp.]|uniref:ABC transporter substrate-binding protein n=1 Tax=Pseudochelatococcus sp. TaxID=2020869 RepID=UPI003D8B1DDB